MGAGILQRQAGFVGEFAEIYLLAMARPRQHADIGPGAEHPVEAGGDDLRADLGMLEPQALNRVVELDIEAQIIGIQLEAVSGPQTARLVHRQLQFGDRPIDVEPPMTIAVGMGAKIDHRIRLISYFISNLIEIYIIAQPRQLSELAESPEESQPGSLRQSGPPCRLSDRPDRNGPRVRSGCALDPPSLPDCRPWAGNPPWATTRAICASGVQRTQMAKQLPRNRPKVAGSNTMLPPVAITAAGPSARTRSRAHLS